MSVNNIYCLFGLKVIGFPTSNSIVEERIKCPECNIFKPLKPQFKYLEIELDYWSDIHLFSAGGCYIVTEKIRKEFVKNEVYGISFQEIDIAFSGIFSFDMELVEKKIPPLFMIIVNNKTVQCKSLIFNLEGRCSQCNAPKVSQHEKTNNILMRSSMLNPDMSELKVYKETWDGSDFFFCELHTEPVITEKVLMILNANCRSDFRIAPAIWLNKTDYLK